MVAPSRQSLAGQKREVAVALENDKKPLEWRKPPQNDETESPTVSVDAFHSGWLVLALFAAAIAIVLIIIAAVKRSLIRDAVLPQMRLEERPYSLGRLQMLVWFCLILSSFLFIFTVTQDLNSITTESFILLGISGSTALAAVAIDQSKNAVIAEAKRKVDALGVVNAGEVDRIYGAPHGTTLGDLGLAKGTGLEIMKVEEWKPKYEQAIDPIRSESLLTDLVNDINGPTIHRWQILIWTAVLGVIYIGKVYMSLETPTFGQNLLALMGISGGVYLGFKIPEKQTS